MSLGARTNNRESMVQIRSAAPRDTHEIEH